MGTINTNKSAAKHCVIFNKHQGETSLDVLNEFIEWTKVKHLKSYIKIADMLNILPSDANKLMHRAILPDKINSAVAKRMKEVMNVERC